MMSYYVLVKDGVVINAIVWDGPGENGENEVDFGEGVTYFKIEDTDQNVGIDWLYKDGQFFPPPQQQPTHDELVSLANQEKAIRLSNADSVFLEWQTKLLLNIASDEEKQAVVNWVNYKDAVKAVDTQMAPDINWPEEPPIPEGGE